MVVETYSNENLNSQESEPLHSDHFERECSDDIFSVSEKALHSDNVSEANENIYNMRELANHIIVGSRNNDSSTDSLKIRLDKINFDCNNNEVIKSSFYPLEELETKKFTEIYNIIYSSQMIIFIDNYKLVKEHGCMMNCFRRKKDLIEEEFPGCTFFPFEYVSKLKKDIHILNNKILDAEMKNQKIYNNDDVCFNLCFDEGEILKKVLYKKMEINNKILFVPITKYQLKQTEYKIRGFCQIVEELGAKQIEIKFKKNNNITTKKNIDATIGSDIELIAGSLGLSSNKATSQEENYSYVLDYPSNNTILLNEKAIRKKIKKKKFIISEDIYNSNLELQYVIRSRCRHFITKYSTVFTFDNSSNIDEKLVSKFKAHNIHLGLELSGSTNKKYYLQIVTDVIFSDQNDYSNNLCGYSVSLDKIGFSFLIDSIAENEDFETNGIYKIMDFINLYIEKVLKHSVDKEYKEVNNILQKIKKNLTMKEYAKLLCNYFSTTSQWIHFNNFIDLLANKTQSYDKLGYLIIMNQKKICCNEKVKILIKFIQEKCIDEKIELNFWKMLQPHNQELNYFLINKLLNEYDFIKNYNWYDLNSLIDNIRMYKVDLNNLDENEVLITLKKNMLLGYKQYEFIHNIIPFILRKAHQMHYKTNDTHCLSYFLELSLNFESFMIANIDTIPKLEEYIKKKIDRVKLGYEMISDFQKQIDESDDITKKFLKLKDFIKSKIFSEKYSYFNKKLNIILPELEDIFILDFVKIYDIELGVQIEKYNLSINDIGTNILKKILGYNEKLNISNVPPNIFGFNMIIKKFNYGVKTLEFQKTVKPYIQKLIDTVIKHNYPIETYEYRVLSDYDIFYTLDLNYFKTKCSNYYSLIISIKQIIKDSTDININNEIINSLIN